MLRPLRFVVSFSVVVLLSLLFNGASSLQLSAAPLSQSTGDFVEVQRLKASDGRLKDGFGEYFEIDGNTLITTSQIGIYIFVYNGTQWVQQARLNPITHTGYATVRGNTAVSIAAADIINNVKSKAYIYTRTGTTWTQQAVLTPSETLLRHLGRAEFIDDNTLLLSASPNFDLDLSGAIYIYKRSGTTWTLQDTLTPSSGLPREDFRNFLLLDNSTLLIGTGLTSPYVGAVYLYTRNGNDWVEQTKLMASDGEEGDNFGRSFAVDGNTVMVGAEYEPFPWDPEAPTDPAGVVYVFNRNGITFTEQQKIPPPDPVSISLSGVIALQGDSALIAGTPFNSESSRIYEFIRSGSTWTQQAVLPTPQYSYSGVKILRQGNIALITAPFYRETNRFAGAIFVLAKNAGSWSQIQTLKPADNLADYSFGRHALLENDSLFVGAPGFVYTTQGEIYVYKRGGAPSQTELLVNGGFEADSDQNKIPDGWSRKNTTKDERRCNKPNETPIAYSGNCAYFMKGGSPTGGKLVQNVNLLQFNLKAGDTIRLNGFYNKQSDGPLFVYLFVSYANFPEEERRIVLRKTTTGYQPINQSSVTLKAVPTRVRVELVNQTTSGKTWIDGMSLILGPANQTLDLPLTLDEQSQTESLIPLP